MAMEAVPTVPLLATRALGLGAAASAPFHPTNPPRPTLLLPVLPPQNLTSLVPPHQWRPLPLQPSPLRIALGQSPLRPLAGAVRAPARCPASLGDEAALANEVLPSRSAFAPLRCRETTRRWVLLRALEEEALPAAAIALGLRAADPTTDPPLRSRGALKGAAPPRRPAATAAAGRTVSSPCGTA